MGVLYWQSCHYFCDLNFWFLVCRFKDGAAGFDLDSHWTVIDWEWLRVARWCEFRAAVRVTVLCSAVHSSVLGSCGMPSVMLSAVLEEEPDLYEAFPPHVDPTGITILTDSPPGKTIILLLIDKPAI